MTAEERLGNLRRLVVALDRGIAFRAAIDSRATTEAVPIQRALYVDQGIMRAVAQAHESIRLCSAPVRTSNIRPLCSQRCKKHHTFNNTGVTFYRDAVTQWNALKTPRLHFRTSLDLVY